MKNNKYKIALILLTVFALATSFAQQPPYKPKLLRTENAPGLIKIDTPENGIGRTYILGDITLRDVDDKKETHIKWTYKKLLLVVEGPYKNGKREGVFVFSAIDSLNPMKTYRIYEQPFKNDQLNGVWKTFNLEGTLVSTQTFENNIAKGLSTTYWIDGKKILDEVELIDGYRKYIQRTYDKNGLLAETLTIENGKANGLHTTYYPNGKPQQQVTLVNGQPNGLAKSWYETGVITDEVNLLNGQYDGIRLYYYPNGKLWIEQLYKEGKSWTVIANYDANGKNRNPGTLNNGNGTLILYNDDGTVRETVNYVNGVAQ